MTQILISGGSGFIGSNLTRSLVNNGHGMTVLTRPAGRTSKEKPVLASFIECDTTTAGEWQKQVGDHEVVINLAGASIFRRWNASAKRLIEESRILTTQNLVEALANRQCRETHFISISGVGYYGHHGDEFIDESYPSGGDFLAQVAKHWEEVALAGRKFGARVVVCRLGHVLGKDNGMLPKLITVSKYRLGCSWGTGQQWISWVHIEELIASIVFLLENKNIEGPLNITAPNPVRNRGMMLLLNRFLHTSPIIPMVPGFALKLAVDEFASVFLNGQRVIPQKLLDSGYDFQFPTLDIAFSDILS